MTARRTSRREFLKAAAAGAAMLPIPAIAQGSGGRVVVVGGGFGGASCARFLKRLDPRITVTLVEANPTFTACPFSNGVIAGLRDLKEQQFGYDKVGAEVTVNISAGTARRCTGPHRDAGQRHTAPLRPPGAVARHRHPLGRPARL